jgi:malonyl-CoA/methylmalonyl-CoA synthetase
MNLIQIFQPILHGRAEKIAFHFPDQSVSFGQIDKLSDNVATALRDGYGVKKGDRTAMFIENCRELIVYYVACLKLGAIVVPFNVLYRDHELAYLLEDAAPKVLLTDAERLAVLRPLTSAPSFKTRVFVAGAAQGDVLSFDTLLNKAAPAPVQVGEIYGEDPALIVYTSGTTGRSKGAVLTHNNLSSNIQSLMHAWQWNENDRFLLSLPMFHLHGLGNGLNGALSSGCTTIILPRFKADNVLKLLSSEKCSLFFGVPTMYERLLEAAAAGVPVPKSMRLFVSGSAALSPETFTRFKQVFGHEILERYGMSETAMITTNLYTGPRKQGSVGTPLPGVEVRIVNDGKPVKRGEVGEIQVRGSNVFKEYWGAPEKTAESLQDGWFKTGDLGSIDADGYVSISGRGKELIISGGFNIYPQEVSQCICRHPKVAEAAVVGVSDKMRGELVKAYIVRKTPDVNADELMQFCKDHLASFKVPKSIVFLDALPRNAMGKLQLQKLPDRDKL